MIIHRSINLINHFIHIFQNKMITFYKSNKLSIFKTFIKY